MKHVFVTMNKQPLSSGNTRNQQNFVLQVWRVLCVSPMWRSPSNQSAPCSTCRKKPNEHGGLGCFPLGLVAHFKHWLVSTGQPDRISLVLMHYCPDGLTLIRCLRSDAVRRCCAIFSSPVKICSRCVGSAQRSQRGGSDRFHRFNFQFINPQLL